MSILQKIKNTYYIYIELAFLFCLSLTPLLWFSPQKMVIGLDSGYPLDFVGYFWQRSFTWLTSVNFGINMTSYIGLLPFHGIQAIISYIGIPFFSVEKVTFVFWFFIMSISMYLFIHYLYPSKKFWILRLTVVIAYVFNLYLYSFWLNGEQPTFSAYSLLPLLMLTLVRFFRYELSPLKAALYVNIAFFLLSAGGITGFPLLGSSMIAIVTLIFFMIFLTKRGNIFSTIKRLGVLFLYAGLFFVLLNAYWLIPFIGFFKEQFAGTVAVNGGGLGANIAWVNFISRHDSFINLFRLQGDNNWYEHPGFYSNNYFTNPLLIAGSFFFASLSYSSLILVKQKKEKDIVIFLATLSLLALFLSSGTHAPFGFVYEFMMSHIPGFIAFRSAYYKFIITVYFSYSVLLGISIYYLFNKYIKNRLQIYLWIVFVCGLFLYNYPFFQKSNFEFAKPFTTMVRIPGYIFDFKKIDNSISKPYRTLVVPPENPNYSLNLYSWGYFSASSLFSLFSKNDYIYDQVQMFANEKELINTTYSLLENKKYEEFLSMMDVLNAHDVLLTGDVVTNYGSSFMESPEVYRKAIEGSGLFHVVWREGPWTLYALNKSEGKKIFVSNFNIYNGEDSYVSQLTTNRTPIIASIGSLQLLSEGANAVINKDPCVSCSIFEESIKPGIPSSYILPGSFLYQVKRWNENRKLEKTKTKEDKLQLLLDLSLKRIGELSSLTLVSPLKTTITEWKPAIDALSSYLDEINTIKIIESTSHNFTQLQEIDNYLHVMDDHIKTIYQSSFTQSSDEFEKSLREIIWKITLANDDTAKIFSTYIQQKNFTYTLTSTQSPHALSIPFSSLPVDSQNNYVFPSSYITNGKPIYPEVSLENSFLSVRGIPAGSTYLTLYFNNIFNEATLAKPVVITLPYEKQNCLAAPITSYSWNSQYLIETKMNNDLTDVFVYVKTLHPQRVVGDVMDNSGYLQYDQVFHFLNTSGNNKYSIFNGKQDSTGAIVYFCAKNSNEFGNLKNNIFLTKLVHPILYENVPMTSNNGNTGLPSISFHFVSPTEYKVDIRNAVRPYLLAFLERFSSQWKVYDDKGNEIPAQHVMVDGYANGWYISRRGDYTLLLRFVPQSLFAIGIIVTIVSAVAIGLSLFAIQLRVKKQVKQ